MAGKYVPPPSLKGKPYEQYCVELALWECITDVAKTKQGGTVAFSLPEDHKSRIREKVFNEISVDDLNKEEGLKTLKTFMDKHLKKDDLTDRWLKYDDFDECKRGDNESIDQFLVNFDEKYKRILKGGTTISSDILAFMMLKRARITKDERLLVVTGMDFSKKDELYEQAQTSLRKFKGDQAYVGGSSTECNTPIKLEPAFFVDNEEALFAAGYRKTPQIWRGRGRGGRGRRGGRGGSGGFNNRQGGDNNNKDDERNGENNNGAGEKQNRVQFEIDKDTQHNTYHNSNYQDFRNRSNRGGKVGRTVNPVGSNGTILTCSACGSFRHLLADCQHSYENLEKVEKANLCEVINTFGEENKYIDNKSICEVKINNCVDEDFKLEMLSQTNDYECGEEEEVDVLFTGAIKANIARLGMEAQNCMVVDSACTKTVCGKQWLKCYIDSLEKPLRAKVTFAPGEKIYKFGGGVKLKSCALVTLPAFIGGVEETIDTDVVDSDIPLLWSTEDMKIARVILNFQNDTAEIYGRIVDLQNTSSGHYCVPLSKTEISIEDVFMTKLANCSNPSEARKTLLHLHRQFAHPTEEKLIKLIDDAGSWKNDFVDILKKIHEECKTCKEYAKVPPRPVVGLPMATKFNQKVAMDLKQWEQRWILHLIDMFTRFTVSVFVNRKKPSVIIDKIMLHWVGVGFGVMGAILTDNGGEFSADEMREVCSILDVFVNTTAAESPFQNGLCERVHSVTDNMLLKLRADNPDISLEVLLCWACNARNALQMWQGFSSYQLVFGQNPNLPNIMTDNPPALEGSTSSAAFAKHITALHSSRQAFIKSESDERIRRALRHKVRASEQKFNNGDVVYYKRQGNERYLGPAKVVFQDGKVVFVRHGGTFVRVSPTHLLKDKNECLGQKTSNEINEVSSPNNGGVLTEVHDGDSDDELAPHVPPQQSILPLQTSLNPTSDSSVSATEIQFPKKGQTIQYKTDDVTWKTAVVTGRGGKVGGKWADWCNVVSDTGIKEGVNLAEKENWRLVDDTREVNEVNVVVIPKSEHFKEGCLKAKEAEIQKLKDFNAIEEVEDYGQFRISSTWVMTRKGEEDRARLVARGFEEENNMPKDSPTISRSTLRLFLSICASKNWKIRSTDIKSAFLQGKLLERDVFITPPKEAMVRKGYIWKLKHCLYGLNDAARQFYISVEECLLSIGCRKSKLDPALFTYHVENELHGMLTCHVDDFAHGGTDDFYKKVVKGAIHARFQVGSSEEGAFKYIGFCLTQNSDGSVILDQSDYVHDMVNMSVSSERKLMSSDELKPNEYTQLRSVVGSLNWAVQGTRPDLAFDMVELSTKSRKGTVSDLVRATKCIKKLKYDDSWLLFPGLYKNDCWRIIVFTDASHANLADGTGSMGAHVVFLVDEHGNCCTLTWHAGKIKRVVRSTIAAEALSLCEGIEDAIYLKHILLQLLPNRTEVVINAFVDNRDVVDALYSTKSVDDKRLRIDISSLKEFISNGEVNSIKWCAGSMQLADGMTKKGAQVDSLMCILRTGKLDLKGWS